MKYYSLPAVIGLLLALQGAAHGALVWEGTAADLHPSLSDKEAVAHFKYKNTGDKPVKITSVHPSCGCTTAALAKDVVAANESGEITATFHIGDRSGVQMKTITVVTDDQPEEPTVLKLKATIPRLLEYTPAFLYWRRGEEHTPKTIEVKIGDFPVTKLDVTSTDPAVKVKSAAVPNEKAFRITVTPDPGDKTVNAALKIQPDFPKEAPKTFYANVRVDAPSLPGANVPGPAARGPVGFGPNGPVANPARAPGVVPTPAASVTPPK